MSPEWVIQVIMPERNGEKRIIGQPIIEIEANKKMDIHIHLKQWNIPDKKKKKYYP